MDYGNERATPIRTGRSLRAASIALLVLAVGLTVMASCARPIRNAIGDVKDIVVFADHETWQQYGEALATIYERTVNVPREEYIFMLRQEPLESWDFFQKYKHVILCAALDEETPAARKVEELLSPEARDRVVQQARGVHVARENMYVDQGQLVLILTADTSENLSAYLAENRQELFDLMSDHYSAHIAELIFRQNERFALEDTLFDQWQFLIRVPYEYRMDASRADESFVRLIKYLPQRYLFTYWMPAEDARVQGLDWVFELDGLGRALAGGIDPEPDRLRALGQQAMNLRDDITREFYDRDEVDRERTTASLVDFNGRWALRLYGVWANMERVVGGPVVSYCFVDPDTQRLWWLDGSLFAPELREKEVYLRQVEEILKTFRTGTAARVYLNSVQEGGRGRR